MTVLAHYTLRRKNIPLVHFRLEAEQEMTAGMAQTIYQVHVTQVEEESRHLLPGTLREQLTDASLLTWIDRRKAPKNGSSWIRSCTRLLMTRIRSTTLTSPTPCRSMMLSGSRTMIFLLYGRTSTSIRIRLTRCWPMSPSRDTANVYPVSYRLRS